MMEEPGSAPSWRFIEGFRLPPDEVASWRASSDWMGKAVAHVPELLRERSGASRDWELRLDPLREVSDVDWRRFRPLRLSREEGWSDWLAHLLDASTTGELGRTLFGAVADLSAWRFDELLAERELTAGGGERRADLVLRVAEQGSIHVEVKVGDQDLAKTFDTSRRLRQEHGRGRPWVDFILLPPSDLEAWDLVAEEAQQQDRPHITPLSWWEVAVALRRSLWLRRENPEWRLWAHSFCGAVEQRLLGCLPSDALQTGSTSLELAGALSTQLRLMREGMP